MRLVESTKVDAQDELSALKHAIIEVLAHHEVMWQQLPEDKALLVDHRGEPLAVMLSYQHFESILAELENLRDAVHAYQILNAIRNGKEETISLAQVEAELRAEGVLDD